MTASESSLLGIAKQTAKGTPNVTHAAFDYLLFKEAALGAQNQFMPLDMEVGGGAMLRNVVKVGVLSGGGISFIPRPKTLGHFLYGVTGSVATVDNADDSYSHTFQLGADQFSAPWFTMRNNIGNLTAEQYPDMRVAQLALRFRSQRFMEAQVAFQGASAPSTVSSSSWNGLAQVDGGPQFLAPVSTIELPTGTQVAVMDGSFVAASQMPTEEQFKIGGYSPDDLSITQRSYQLSLAVKINDATLYRKIMIDPAGGAAWAASIFREANFKIIMRSDIEIDTGVPYSLTIEANGASGANANVTWQAQPIPMRAGRQLIMAVTGTFLASPIVAAPLKLTLVNATSSY
jgi:hypothetical protein